MSRICARHLGRVLLVGCTLEGCGLDASTFPFVPDASEPATEAHASAALPKVALGTQADSGLRDGAADAPDAVSGQGPGAQAAGCRADSPCRAPELVCEGEVCEDDSAAPPATWLRSAWSGRVGLVAEDDSTLWCTPVVEAGGTTDKVTSGLARVRLSGQAEPSMLSASTAQRLRVHCAADATPSAEVRVVISSWSRDAAGNALELACPKEQPRARLVECQVAQAHAQPLVYAGASCGDGVAGIAAAPAVLGQLVGDHYELSAKNKPLFNDTGRAAVVGTDLGFQFLAQGRMYLGFGDTWENDFSLPGIHGYRGSILAYTHDFDPADQNGIAIEGWETAPYSSVAREIIESPHDALTQGEFTAIATAGFGLSEGDAHYRFLWFSAIEKWDPFTSTESTLAWSQDGQPFVRGDQAPGVHPPRWAFESAFGPGAVWVDREHGYVYFFGVRTYQTSSPLRVARVRATRDAVLDHLQYEYFTRAGWQHPDPRDEYALANLVEPESEVVGASATQHNRPEFSVSYNPYVGRFLLFMQNDATPFTDEAQTYLQLWQAEAPEGPYTLVDTGDTLVLPPHLYGPYTSEQLLSDDGRAMAFALSDWNLKVLLDGQPYVVGLWQMALERGVRAGCARPLAPD
jgi:hypothetical protein